MAEEEDFSQLPLIDQFQHKNWKARKGGYEAASKEFKTAQESDTIVQDFTRDPNLWKGAVADSNVAAQQEGLAASCAFSDIAGSSGATRTRSLTIAPIVEKGLTGRPAAKASALEALMLYIEIDKPDPVIEELSPLVSHKQPKVIAATLSALTAIFHAYGCKTVEPKPVIKILPKVFGHADKNVRAEAQNLTVEFYRWSKDAMKPLFWGDLKPVQQTDSEKLFEKVKDEPPPKQERLLRSQQEREEAAPAGATEDAGEGGDEEEGEIDLEPEFMAVDVFPKIPKDFSERLSSAKWKDRKEALDDLFAAINVPAIEEGPFDEIIQGCAKSMKDANIMVVTIAANCVEASAKGLKKSFSKYRSSISSPMLERSKEKKQSVTDSIGAACDAVAMSTGLSPILEEVSEFLKHKNPQVKMESTKFLTRCLKTTREAPQPAEVKLMADAATKSLTESQATTRDAGAEILGVLWKIMGDRNMLMHLEGLDDIRKNKIKEYCDNAEVKAKWKPKAAPAPKPAAAPAATRKPALGTKRPAAGVKKPAPASRPMSPPEEQATAPLQARPTSRPGPGSKSAPRSGLAPPGSGSKRPGAAASPKRPTATPTPSDDPISAPRGLSAPGRGLAARPLGKPPVLSASDSYSEAPPAAAPAPSAMSMAERAELSDLRAEVELLRSQNSDLRTDKSRSQSQIHESQNQNAALIEDHTRDMLSVKAKETQLVRARSDAEAAEERNRGLERDNERLKREVNRLSREAREGGSGMDGGYGVNGGGMENGYGRQQGYQRSFDLPVRDRGGNGKESGFGDSEKENTPSYAAPQPERKPSPAFAQARTSSDHASSGRASPALSASPSVARRTDSEDGGVGAGLGGSGVGRGSVSRSASGDGVEGWRRAAEVTANSKQRIEMMKAKQNLARGH